MQEIELQPIESSNVSAAGYDDETETLEIEFKGGARYQYQDVPRPVFDGLIEAESAGRYLAQEIKGTFSFERVE